MSTWCKTWAYFGYPNVTTSMSAYNIIPEDREAADYIFGWYLYVLDSEDYEVPQEKNRRQGWLDAKDHYDG